MAILKFLLKRGKTIVHNVFYLQLLVSQSGFYFLNGLRSHSTICPKSYSSNTGNERVKMGGGAKISLIVKQMRFL